MKKITGHLTAPLLATFFLGALFSFDALAVSPPETPLPPCQEVNSQQQGACPQTQSDLVSGSADKRFVAGQPVMVTTKPDIPKCARWDQPANAWSPSKCYNGFRTPLITGCAVLDLRDGQFKRMPCPTALYTQSKATTSSQLFEFHRPAYDTTCGLRSSFWGDSETNRQGGQIWMQADASWLDCEITLKGTRPDGLYGPTWVTMIVGVDVVESGCCGADPRYPEGHDTEIFIPVDGDLRSASDVEVNATGALGEVNWDAGRVFATYKATITNIGTEETKNVELTAKFPAVSIVQQVSGAACTMPGNVENPSPASFLPRGGVVACKWPKLAAHESASIEIVARIINATDFASLQRGEFLENFQNDPKGVLIKAKADSDVDPANNEVLVKVDVPFRTGSYEETRVAMETLAPYFDYTTNKYKQQCNIYKDDIYERLEKIRTEHPEAFSMLSYGGITSGQYLVLGVDSRLTRAGHVGVVVYMKGTDFRRTGIVISGTPTPSPLNLTSEIGPKDPGGGFGVGGWTARNGLYLRTPANKFPGTPQQESQGLDGFEGKYPGNVTEFTFGAVMPDAPVASDPMTCPLAPDAVTITTESPVEIIATNSKGERVETKDGAIATQQVGSGIHSMAFPHEDGTFAWTLVLPVDDYDVKLVGTRTGPYKLILTTFGPDGTPIDKVTEGFTSPGQTDDYVLEAPEPAAITPTPQIPGGNNGTDNGNGTVKGGGNRGGGGAITEWMALSLLLLLGVRGYATMSAARSRRSVKR